MKKGILLFTENISNARAEVNGLGGHITQEFTPNVFIANLPDSVSEESLKQSTTQKPAKLDEVSEIAASAWSNLQVGMKSPSSRKGEGLSWDTPGFEPPSGKMRDDFNNAFAKDIVSHSTGTPTSLYMTGSVAVGIIVVSGNTANLTFSVAERTKTITEIQQAFTFLANAEPRAKLKFVWDIRFINVSAAPGSTSEYESAEAPWRNAALGEMGFSGNRAGSVAYVNDLRNRKKTDWAYVAYFTKYPLHHFAYAGQERLVMHYANDGWGPDNINRVFAHESCHIFGAADEYGNCSCGGSHGQLGIPNNNCVNCAGVHVPCLMDANVESICQWSRKQIGWDESLFPQGLTAVPKGIYTIRQKSNNRYVDAYQTSDKDFAVVTRPAQNNDSQRWALAPIGTIFTMQQKSNGRYMDAHEYAGKDFNVVSRPNQNHDTQRWLAIPVPNTPNNYRIQQLSGLRFLDGHPENENDYRVVTRPYQDDSSQRWKLIFQSGNDYKIQHMVNNRYLDAYETEAKDYQLVTRLAQAGNTQIWTLTPIGGIYTVSQVSSNRRMDGYNDEGHDFRAVTRPSNSNTSQKWAIISKGLNNYSIQELSNSRFLDAHEIDSLDFQVVTRPDQNNDTQRWLIDAV